MSLVLKARTFAVGRHGRQTRKYVNELLSRHLEAVVSHLVDHGIDDEEVLAAAYLHDVIEDTPTTIEELMAVFGAHTAELVYWMTDAEVGSRTARKTMFCWRIGRAPWEAKLIKMADIVDNAATIRLANPAFATEYLTEKTQMLDQMALIESQRLTDLRLYKLARRMVDVGPTPGTHSESRSAFPS
jgi:(p)ppGpp synthase/HD superfamily hydrolase